MIKKLEWLGSGTGLLFASLLAFGIQVGWVFALVSNVSWFTVGLKTKSMPMVYMQTGFAITSIIGLYNWIKLW